MDSIPDTWSRPYSVRSKFSLYKSPGGGLPIKRDGGSECWALSLTLKYKKKDPIFDTLEYNFFQNWGPWSIKVKNQIP